MVIAHTNAKIKVRGQPVKKAEWKQTVERTRPIAKMVGACVCSSRPITCMNVCLDFIL